METPNVDNQAGNGAGGTTTPSASPQAGGSVAGNAAELPGLVRSVVKEVLETELKPIKGDISGIYSRQDKDRNAMREFMDEVKKQQAKGLTEDQAIDAAQNALTERAETAQEKRMLKEIHAKLFGSPSAQPAGNGASGANDAAAVLSELELDANSADVIAILGKGLDPDKQELELRRYAARSKPQPSAASASSIVGEPPAPKPDTEAKIARLQELQKNPQTNWKQIQELTAELDKTNWK